MLPLKEHPPVMLASVTTDDATVAAVVLLDTVATINGICPPDLGEALPTDQLVKMKYGSSAEAPFL